jgi:ATP-binding cassette subfamily F protein 3
MGCLERKNGKTKTTKRKQKSVVEIKPEIIKTKTEKPHQTTHEQTILKNELKQLQKKLSKIDEAINNLNTKKENIEIDLAKPENYTNNTIFTQLEIEYKKVLEEKMEFEINYEELFEKIMDLEEKVKE